MLVKPVFRQCQFEWTKTFRFFFIKLRNKFHVLCLGLGWLRNYFHRYLYSKTRCFHGGNRQYSHSEHNSRNQRKLSFSVRQKKRKVELRQAQLDKFDEANNWLTSESFRFRMISICQILTETANSFRSFTFIVWSLTMSRSFACSNRRFYIETIVHPARVKPNPILKQNIESIWMKMKMILIYLSQRISVEKCRDVRSALSQILVTKNI